MHQFHAQTLLMLTTAAICATAPADAANPLDVYVGAAIGQARVRENEVVFGGPLGFDEHHSAWKVLAGVRPLSVVGAEFEYIDFGHPRASYGLVTADVHKKGAALWGVGYLPLPTPFDVFAKAGLARVSTSASGQVSCPPPLFCFGLIRLDRTSTDFAYGGGVRFGIGSFALRAEYERVSERSGDPGLLSIGVTWTF